MRACVAVGCERLVPTLKEAGRMLFSRRAAVARPAENNLGAAQPSDSDDDTKEPLSVVFGG